MTTTTYTNDLTVPGRRLFGTGMTRRWHRSATSQWHRSGRLLDSGGISRLGLRLEGGVSRAVAERHGDVVSKDQLALVDPGDADLAEFCLRICFGSSLWRGWVCLGVVVRSWFQLAVRTPLGSLTRRVRISTPRISVRITPSCPIRAIESECPRSSRVLPSSPSRLIVMPRSVTARSW